MKTMFSRNGTAAALELVLTLPIREADFTIEPGKGDKGEHDFVQGVLMTPDVEGGMHTPLTEVIGQVTSAQIYRRAFFLPVEKTFKTRESDGKIIYDKLAYRPPATCQARYNDRTGEPNGFRQQVWLFGGNLMLSRKQKVPGYVDIPKVRSYIYTHGKHREPLTGVSEVEVAWWNLAYGTLVQTPDGPARLEDIEAGDYVIGADGQPTEVLKTVECGQDQMYRVTLRDGRSAECGENHLWAVYDKSQLRSGRGGTYRVLTLRQIMDAGLERNMGKYHRQFRFAVPRCQPVEYPERALPVDPYVLGAWLGDGSLIRNGSKRWYPSFSCMPESRFIAEEISPRLPPDITLARSGDPANGNWLFRPETSWDTHPFRDALVALGLIECMSADKFIPQIYMQGSVKQRLDLLRGLMDTDGTCYSPNGRNSQARFITSSHRLAHDVQHLVRSLGGRAVLGGNGPRGDLYVQINLEFCPFLLPRKADRWTPRGGDTYRSDAIVSIEPTSVKDSRCIVVAAEDHLFVVNDFMVTHNCHSTQMKLLFLWYLPILGGNGAAASRGVRE